MKKYSTNLLAYDMLKSSQKIQELENLSSFGSDMLAENIAIRAFSRFYTTHYNKELKTEDKQKMYDKVLFIASKKSKVKKIIDKSIKQEYKSLELIILNNFSIKEIKLITKLFKTKIALEFLKTKNNLYAINKSISALKNRVVLLNKYRGSKKLDLVRTICLRENIGSRMCNSKDFSMIYLNRYKVFSDKKLREFLGLLNKKSVIKLNYFTNKWFKTKYLTRLETNLKSIFSQKDI
jgi:hypothetical protein